MQEDARELCKDMMDVLDSCLLQMQVAGLGYATRTLEEQIAGFTERMSAVDEDGNERSGSIELACDGGQADTGNVIRVWGVSSVEIEETPDPPNGNGRMTALTVKAVCNMNGPYAVAIGTIREPL